MVACRLCMCTRMAGLKNDAIKDTPPAISSSCATPAHSARSYIFCQCDIDCLQMNDR